MKIEPRFDIQDKVIIDGCKDLVGVITGITWRHPMFINYEVSWVVDGESKSFVIEGWRVEKAE